MCEESITMFIRGDTIFTQNFVSPLFFTIQIIKIIKKVVNI